MSKLGILNFLILQWFFIRLAKNCKKDDVTGEYVFEHWCIIYFVVPLTGWWNNYVFIKGKFNYLKLKI